MNNTCERDVAKDYVLCEETVDVGGYSVVYRLRFYPEREDSRFCVTVRVCSEECEISTGNDLSRAWSFYRLILCGEVTPCTLEDIWQDFDGKEYKKRKIQKNSLQDCGFVVK